MQQSGWTESTEQDYSNIIATFKSLEARGITTSIILDPAYAAYDKQGLAGSSKASLHACSRSSQIPSSTWLGQDQTILEYNDRAERFYLEHPKGKALTDEQEIPLLYGWSHSCGTLSQPPARTQKALLNLATQGLLLRM